MTFQYKPKPEKKLRADFSRRKSNGLNGFTDFDEFKNWYGEIDKACFYCGLKEKESQELVITGVLTSSRFPQNGVLGQGRSRGMWLEIDRIDPKEKYSMENCVLCCYFCNNDKSDVFHGSEYKEFQNSRVGYLRTLINGNYEKK